MKLSKNKNYSLYTQHMHNHNMYSNHTYITYSLCVHTCMNNREIHLENVTGSLFLLFHFFLIDWCALFSWADLRCNSKAGLELLPGIEITVIHLYTLLKLYLSLQGHEKRKCDTKLNSKVSSWIL